VQIVRRSQNFGKSGVVADHDPWKKRIGGLHVTDTSISHPLAQRLTWELQIMVFRQRLSCKDSARIRVVLTDQSDCKLMQGNRSIGTACLILR